MTPGETAELLRALGDESWRQMERLGWAVLMLLQPWSREPLSLDRLLGGEYVAWRLGREERRA